MDKHQIVMNFVITENQYINLNEKANPLWGRWHKERATLKNYPINYGDIMVSKENGKEYKVIYDQFLSNQLGINYCICIQWDSLTNEPGDIIYVRAYDKFSYK